MIDVIRFDVKTNGCYAVDTIPWSKHFDTGAPIPVRR